MLAVALVELQLVVVLNLAEMVAVAVVQHRLLVQILEQMH